MRLLIKDYKAGNAIGLTFGAPKSCYWIAVRALWLGIRLEVQRTL